jgi:hypothetical protein
VLAVGLDGEGLVGDAGEVEHGHGGAFLWAEPLGLM